jgi:hypothetical protein
MHRILLEVAALDGSSDRSALSWTRFSLNSTSAWAGEGPFHAFDLAKCDPESWRERESGSPSSDTRGRRGRFPALAGRLVAECGRPAP